MSSGSSAFHRSNQSLCPIGHYCVSGLLRQCPPGRYGNATGEVRDECAGACEAGYYCPIGSISSRQVPCGSPSVYCPAGSAVPTFALPGAVTTGDSDITRSAAQWCVSGQYCVNGTAYPCNPGRFGCASGLSTGDCNGPCLSGYYCLSGSWSNRQLPCGNASVYCEQGVFAPAAVGRGNYSYGGDSPTSHGAQQVCEAGWYCDGGQRVRVLLLACY